MGRNHAGSGARLWCIFCSAGDLDAFNLIRLTLTLRR